MSSVSTNDTFNEHKPQIKEEVNSTTTTIFVKPAPVLTNDTHQYITIKNEDMEFSPCTPSSGSSGMKCKAASRVGDVSRSAAYLSKSPIL